ncbi:iron complex transport system permease protein [Kribbella sp. VKM Ac-2527]|uniref:Iron complex transport system permease protein n=1 Tax=Kribbella caucasensis TaxID=2512215 RepID=A0A4R6KNS2_9ACTN|nr:iron ABC transporter permease [Kribbella sp. VKM Ac-2527]TDO52305.1 iron complex transport system permease protein [Kribbella sp. VKM Ac-2527]
MARRTVALAVLLLVVVVAFAASLALGSRWLGLGAVARALVDGGGSDADVIVRSLRLPRTVVAVLIGACLGVAGTLMQGHTRNALAEPGIFGVSSGAALAVVLGLQVGVVESVGSTVWCALIGALVATFGVQRLAARGTGASPVGLALTGAAVAALLGAMTSAIVLLDADTLDGYRFWAVGSVSGRGLDVAVQVLPFAVVGLVLAAINARDLDLLALGDDVAAGLGLSVRRARFVGLVAIGLLTAAGVAACGPIGFLGLLAGHVARRIFGSRNTWLIPAAALTGAAALILADVVGRLLGGAGEVQAGVVLGLVGAPLFVVVVRRRAVAL